VSEQQINNNLLPQTHFTSSFINLYCDFNFGGAPVDVANPTAIVTDMNDVAVNVTVIRPLSKPNKDVTGRYSFSFLTEGLAAGTYNIIFTGVYPSGAVGESVVSETLRIVGKFDIESVSTELYYINWLRMNLFDAYTSFYRITDPNEYSWNDEMLYYCLTTSLSRINGIPPVADYTINQIRNAGFEASLLDGAKYEALFSRAVGEILNDFSYSDGLTLTLDRHSKYRAMAADIWATWIERVSLIKEFACRSGGWIGIRGWPMPPTTSMQLALMPNWQNTISVYT